VKRSSCLGGAVISRVRLARSASPDLRSSSTASANASAANPQLSAAFISSRTGATTGIEAATC